MADCHLHLIRPSKNQLKVEKKSICCIACSTKTSEIEEGCNEWFKANFGEAEEPHLIGLDNMRSRHLFSNESDFVGEITPINPLEICGVAGGFTAKGEGTVRIRFRNDSGKLVDKKIYKALYAPESMVRLISITQLARQAPANEITKATTFKDTTELFWEGEKVTVSHPPPSFLEAYLGNPPESYGTFYKSVCAFIADTPQRIPYEDEQHSHATEGWKHQVNSAQKTVSFAEPVASVLNESAVKTADDTAQEDEEYERNSPMEDFRLNLACLQAKWAPFQLPRVDREYLSMHYCLGHLPHSQMQLLVQQGKLPARFKQCSAPACSACIFAMQQRKPWRTKGGGGQIRKATETKPGDGTSTDQMESSVKGLVQQSTGNLTRQHVVGATIFC